MKIVADIAIPFIKGVLEPYCDVVYKQGNLISADDVRDADALLVRTRTRCDAALLEGSKVSIIATATIGFDHIDMDYCRRAGIEVATAAGSNARGVLQWVAAALVRASAHQGWEPEQRRLGVVGTGNVGCLIAKYALHWGFDVLCCDPPLERKGMKDPNGEAFVSFGTIRSECDIITFHTPLTLEGEDKTFHMADGGFFRNIRRGSLILNSSRGEVIDTTELQVAVAQGRCSCCIDTWENEPQLDTDLLEAALIGTPHIAGYSAQGKANAASMSVCAIAGKFGLPLTDWYPETEVPRIEPRSISWGELKSSIGQFYDIRADSETLKSAPSDFEQLRNQYHYRQEYF